MKDNSKKKIGFFIGQDLTKIKDLIKEGFDKVYLFSPNTINASFKINIPISIILGSKIKSKRGFDVLIPEKNAPSGRSLEYYCNRSSWIIVNYPACSKGKLFRKTSKNNLEYLYRMMENHQKIFLSKNIYCNAFLRRLFYFDNPNKKAERLAYEKENIPVADLKKMFIKNNYILSRSINFNEESFITEFKEANIFQFLKYFAIPYLIKITKEKST
jgi:hypothetical protein